MALSRDHYVVFDDTSSHQHLQAPATPYCIPPNQLNQQQASNKVHSNLAEQSPL